MSVAIVFDADNTIWDTDSVFRNAQLSILRNLAQGGYLADPRSQLSTLRAFDTALIAHLGTFEYDFRLLIMTLVEHYTRPEMSVEEIIGGALGTHAQDIAEVTLIERCISDFEHELRKVPELYDDAIPVLTKLRDIQGAANQLVTILFSEGKSSRLERILGEHHIRQQRLFDEIVLLPKSKAVFIDIKRLGKQLLMTKYGGSYDRLTQYVMVGDNLERDIYFANQAGFVTIYKPSNFKGMESFRTKFRHPDEVIQNLRELPNVLDQRQVITLTRTLRVSQRVPKMVRRNVTRARIETTSAKRSFRKRRSSPYAISLKSRTWKRKQVR